MANKKMTFAVCTFKSELSNFAGKAYDEVICVDNFQYLPSSMEIKSLSLTSVQIFQVWIS